MSIETESKNYLERAREAEPSKEQEIDPELQKGAAMERADFLTKEIKSSQKQMQNIILHIQQVTQAIRQLRQLLSLAVDDGDPTSIKRDKEKVESLKKKIFEYQDELVRMKDDLVREQVQELKEGIGVGMSASDLHQKAVNMVEKMIENVE